MAPSEVLIIGEHPVSCASREVVEKLQSPFNLGPLDLLAFHAVPVDNVFVYTKPQDIDTSDFMPVERLAKATEFLLDYYPHLTGRVCAQDDGRRSIVDIGKGTLVLEAKCTRKLEEFRSSSGRIIMEMLPGSGDSLTPPFDPSFEGFLRDPIFSIQHTRFACGSVALGIRIHHTATDAGGFFMLSRHLAELYRDLSHASTASLSDPPITRLYLQEKSDMSAQELNEALQYNPRFYCLRKEGESPVALSQAEFPILARTLHFSEDDLFTIKKEATNPQEDRWISTFEALCAYLDQSIYRSRVKFLISRGKSESQAAEELFRGFFASVDMRKPERLGLSNQYFGNGVHPVYTQFSHDLLMNQPLWKVAQAMHDLIRSVDRELMRKTPRWIAAQPQKGLISMDFSFAYGNFTVSQWSAFDMYQGCDFDTDRAGNPVLPSLSGPPYTIISRVDALALVLDGWSESIEKRERRALDVHVTASEPLWRYLDEDAKFRECYSENRPAV